MRERKLCIFCLFFLVFQIIWVRGLGMCKDLKPSYLEKTAEEGSVITVSGTVFHREVKKDNLVCYLTATSCKTNIIVYIKQTNSETNMSQSSVENQNSTDEQIHIGNQIQVTGEVSFPQVPRNPGNFNQKFYYQKQEIHGMMWVSEYQILENSENRWKESMARLRIRWKRLLVTQLGEEMGNTMSAILLGDKSELDEDLKELYQKNGIGHILAISGLHMTFLGLGFYQFLRKRGCSFVSAGIIGIFFLVSYSIMIGNGVSSMRALVMFIVRIGADMTGRVYDMLTALAVAAMVILCWRPLYLYDAGFLLSFGALLGILLIHPVFRKNEKPHYMEKHYGEKSECYKVWVKKTLENTLQGISASLGIHLAILPCMLYFYFEIPPYSILLNLLVIPLMSVVLGAGAVGSGVCALVPFAGSKILWICKPILWLYRELCDMSIQLPASRIVTGQPELWQIILYYVLLAVLLCLLRRSRNIGKCGAVWTVLLISSPIILCITAYHHYRPHTLSVAMLDVGQGDGIVIQTPGGMVCMVDGGSSDVSRVGKYRIEPYLKSRAVGSLDYVFISHGDGDHCSGIEEMLERQAVGVRIQNLVLPVRNVWDEKLENLAETAIRNGTKVLVMEEGKTVEKDEFSLTCLQPGSSYDGKSGNAASMVLSLHYKKFDMLLTGDVEGAGEELLCETLQTKPEFQDYDVLKAAHHGSKNSGSRQFLELVSPEVTLISAGQKNRYGHPHEETIQRLEEAGSQIYRTDQSGAVMVWTEGKKMKIERYIGWSF